MAKIVNARTTGTDTEVSTTPETPTTPTEGTKDPTTSTEEEEKDPTYPDNIERWGFLTGVATRKWVRKMVEKLSGGTTPGDGEATSRSVSVGDVKGLDLSKYATKTDLSGYVTKAQYDELVAKVQALEAALNG